MKRFAWRAAVAFLVAGAWVGAARAAETIAPWTGSYELTRGVLSLGDANVDLAKRGADGCWRYEYKASSKGVARLFIGDVSEQTDFCIQDDKLRSQRFEYHRSDKPKDDFSLEFDWKTHVVRVSTGDIRQLTDDVVDRLAMHIAVQRWVIEQKAQPGPAELSVTKIEKGKPKTYRFRIVAREQIKVPAGSFETIRVERVDNPEKSVRFWLAPEKGYIPIRVEQVEDGNQQFKMELKG